MVQDQARLKEDVFKNLTGLLVVSSSWKLKLHVFFKKKLLIY